MPQCNAILRSAHRQCKKEGTVVLRDDRSYCNGHAPTIGAAFFCELCMKYTSVPGNWASPKIQACGHTFCECCLGDRLRSGETTCPTCAEQWNVEEMQHELYTLGELLADTH